MADDPSKEFPDATEHEAIQMLEIQYRGMFAYDELYKLMFFWLKEKDFKSKDGSDKYEDFYYENIWTGGELKEVWYWWRGYKKEGELFTYRIQVEGHILGMKNSKRIVEGKQIKTNELEVAMFFKAHVITEKDIKFKQNWLTSNLKDYFWRNTYKLQLDQKTEELYNLTHQLINTVKQFWGLQMDVEVAEPFHNREGIPQLR